MHHPERVRRLAWRHLDVDALIQLLDRESYAVAHDLEHYEVSRDVNRVRTYSTRSPERHQHPTSLAREVDFRATAVDAWVEATLEPTLEKS
jgi:hypothetical protein